MSAEDDRAAGASDPNERRDAALKQTWGDASRETSPPHVDARILAAARAAVAAERRRDETPRRRFRWNVVQRWQPALAAAAVAGLAFVLVPLTLSPPPAERATAPVTIEAATPADSMKTYETLPPASPGARDDAGESRASASERPAREARPERAIGSGRPAPAPADAQASAPAAVPAPPPAGEATFDLAAPADDTRSEEPSSAASGAPGSPGQVGSVATRPRGQAAAESSRASEGAAAAPPMSQAREKRAEEATTVDARARAARVEDLYRAGEIAAAAQELRAFRADEPGADDYLPDELRDWARTVD